MLLGLVVHACSVSASIPVRLTSSWKCFRHSGRSLLQAYWMCHREPFHAASHESTRHKSSPGIRLWDCQVLGQRSGLPRQELIHDKQTGTWHVDIRCESYKSR